MRLVFDKKTTRRVTGVFLVFIWNVFYYVRYVTIENFAQIINFCGAYSFFMAKSVNCCATYPIFFNERVS